MSKIRVIGRWRRSIVVASVGFLVGLGFKASGEAPDGRSSVHLVAQKQQTKKKATPSKKAADASGDAGTMEPSTKADAAAPSGEAGAPSFRREIAPILVANCVGCHTGTGAGLARGKLSMASFEKLMAGGKRGKDIIPGDPDTSHLVLMIKGEETPKMPPNNGQRGFSAAAGEKIEAWVKAGARLDAGLSATDPLDKYAPSTGDLRRDELAKMKPEERDKLAEQTGRERWKKATPTVPDVTAGAHFLAFGNLPGDRTTKLLKAMEAQYILTNKLLGSPRSPALDPTEKISLYIFKNQNTFVEFVRTIENQEVEAGEQARAKLNVEAPYLAAVDPANGGEEVPMPKKGAKKSKKGDDSLGGPERSLLGLLTEQLVTGAANRANKAPRWVALGLGAYASSLVEGGSPYYRRLRAETLENVRIGWQVKATEALGGQASTDTTRAIGYSLFEWMAANGSPSAMNGFLKVMLDGGNQLDDAIMNCLGLNREQFLEASGGWFAERYRR